MFCPDSFFLFLDVVLSWGTVSRNRRIPVYGGKIGLLLYVSLSEWFSGCENVPLKRFLGTTASSDDVLSR